MRLLTLFLFVLLIPSTTMARCVPFDFFESIDKIPFIIHGKVTQSNKKELLSEQCDRGLEACIHRFNIDVIEILKGNTSKRKIQFQYRFVHQRPNIIVFAEGDEYIFAVSEVTSDGKASLLGNTCGRSGLGVEYIDKIKEVLKRNQ
jgi:hypothetical protein